MRACVAPLHDLRSRYAFNSLPPSFSINGLLPSIRPAHRCNMVRGVSADLFTDPRIHRHQSQNVGRTRTTLLGLGRTEEVAYTGCWMFKGNRHRPVACASKQGASRFRLRDIPVRARQRQRTFFPSQFGNHDVLLCPQHLLFDSPIINDRPQSIIHPSLYSDLGLTSLPI